MTDLIKSWAVLIGLMACVGAIAQPDPRLNPAPDKPRPIAAADEVAMARMTWMEVRDAIAAGKTTAIVATGGLEMNGPYLVTGKHNIVCEVLGERIARALGNALLATVVPYVPEGNFTPPDGHMRYPGTIGVSEDTYRALLADIALSLRRNGFRHIVFIGDSGGNTGGMAAVAERLSRAWAPEVGVHHVGAFYNNKKWRKWLAKNQGIAEKSEGIHDSYRYTAMLMLADPAYVRAKERQARGLFSINGVPLAPVAKTLAIAEALAAYQVSETARAIRVAVGE